MTDEAKRAALVREFDKAIRAGDIDSATAASRKMKALLGFDDTRSEAEKYDFDAPFADEPS